MSISNLCGECTSTKMIITGAAVLTAATITLIVVGILGMSGVIPMAPIGGQIMVELGSALILGMILGVVRFCCTSS